MQKIFWIFEGEVINRGNRITYFQKSQAEPPSSIFSKKKCSKGGDQGDVYDNFKKINFDNNLKSQIIPWALLFPNKVFNFQVNRKLFKNLFFEISRVFYKKNLSR